MITPIVLSSPSARLEVAPDSCCFWQNFPQKQKSKHLQGGLKDPLPTSIQLASYNSELISGVKFLSPQASNNPWQFFGHEHRGLYLDPWHHLPRGPSKWLIRSRMKSTKPRREILAKATNAWRNKKTEDVFFFSWNFKQTLTTWQFFMPFWGWLSDPIQRLERWPPNFGEKGHGESPGSW